MVEVESTTTQSAAANAASPALTVEEPGAALSQKRTMLVRSIGRRGRIDTAGRKSASLPNASGNQIVILNASHAPRLPDFRLAVESVKEYIGYTTK